MNEHACALPRSYVEETRVTRSTTGRVTLQGHSSSCIGTGRNARALSSHHDAATTRRGVIMGPHATAFLLILLAGQVSATDKNGTTIMNVQDLFHAVESAFDKIGNTISSFFDSKTFSCSFGISPKYYKKSCADSEKACLTANITIGQANILFKDCVKENVCNSTEILAATIANISSFQMYKDQNLTVKSSECCKTSRCNAAPHSRPVLPLALLFAPVLPLLMHSG
ncbi:uncharacterized protein LOC116940273 isoform X1 [Petromyzon marinus]|uniref:Uncharacterized protein LOC116940273 isoform X2 n=1 Tax=Petromyzon marinus TaxID=7757 RepID=A0AAJ7SU92_PETMA|nr:uncharacterized protein LOC116940273 isoform X2 [Petromyzon marinus]